MENGIGNAFPVQDPPPFLVFVLLQFCSKTAKCCSIFLQFCSNAVFGSFCLENCSKAKLERKWVPCRKCIV